MVVRDSLTLETKSTQGLCLSLVQMAATFSPLQLQAFAKLQQSGTHELNKCHQHLLGLNEGCSYSLNISKDQALTSVELTHLVNVPGTLELPCTTLTSAAEFCSCVQVAEQGN